MELKERINADYMIAFRAKDKVTKTFLSVIKGEIQNAESKGPVDVMSILKAAKKNLEKSIEMGSTDAIEELHILEQYLPKTMDIDDIEFLINSLITSENASGMKDMGRIMQIFNSKYPGQDGKIVSQIVKKLLSK